MDIGSNILEESLITSQPYMSSILLCLGVMPWVINSEPFTMVLVLLYNCYYSVLSLSLGLARDPNSLANLDQDLPNYAQHSVPIFSLPQEWLWCESWCSDDSKENSKTIDLCNNPRYKVIYIFLITIRYIIYVYITILIF
jgi:hypothetical protein